MLNSVETPKVVQFKATNNAKASRNYSQAPMPIGRDSYVKQKEDSKEKWYKAGVIAGVVLAVSFGVQAILSGLTHGATKRMLKAQEQYFLKAAEQTKNGASDELKALTDVAIKWTKFEGKNKVAPLTSETTSKKVKEELLKLLDLSSLSDVKKQLSGAKDRTRLFFLYGEFFVLYML